MIKQELHKNQQVVMCKNGYSTIKDLRNALKNHPDPMQGENMNIPNKLNADLELHNCNDVQYVVLI